MQTGLAATKKQDIIRPLLEATATQAVLAATTNQAIIETHLGITVMLTATAPMMIFPSLLPADTLPTKSLTVVPTIRYSTMWYSSLIRFKLTTFSGQQI
jgi:hypothetical protein